MSVLRKIITALYSLLFLLGGLWLMALSRNIIFDYTSWIQNLAHRLTPERLFMGGVISFLAGLLPLIIKIIELRGSRYVAFDNPEGEVAIALHTIEEFVNRVAKSFEEVLQVKPVIIPKKKAGVEIMMEVVLEEGTNIPQLTENIQHQIKSQLHELLGIENIAGVQINVVKIQPRVSGLEV